MSQSGKYFVRVSGSAEEVDKAKHDVRTLISSVAYGREKCGKPGDK